MKKILCIMVIATTALLQACIPAAVIGVGVAGSALYVKRTSTFQRFYTDTDITNQAFVRLKADRSLKGSRILVATKNQNVLLIGQTPAPSQRMEAERLIQAIPGVNRIYNAITIAGPTSSLTQSSDSWITTKTKSELIQTKSLHAAKIKVVTENGVVYLMGNTSRAQGALAADVARRVAGVQKVVKLFDYTD